MNRVSVLRRRHRPGTGRSHASCSRWARAMCPLAVAACMFVLLAGCSGPVNQHGASFVGRDSSQLQPMRSGIQPRSPIDASLSGSESIFDVEFLELPAGKATSDFGSTDPAAARFDSDTRVVQPPLFAQSQTADRAESAALFELPPQPAMPVVALGILGLPQAALLPGPGAGNGMSLVQASAAAPVEDQFAQVNGAAEAGATGGVGTSFLAPAAGMFLAAVMVVPLGCSVGAGLMFPRQRRASARASPPRWLDVRIRRPQVDLPPA